MTVKECYEQAVAVIPEVPEDNTDMQKFAVTWCNILLAETFPYENAFRKGKGIPLLSEVPKVREETEEIPYNDSMVRAAFPYGMARWVLRENEDISGSHEYYQLYSFALTESVPAFFAEIEDCC
ncbi:MAG: hypothetical protein IJO22_06125 [Oscillospiraceae bacterium]|nr:hypothetical protein [Oscillospiraceae bacterium]